MIYTKKENKDDSFTSHVLEKEGYVEKSDRRKITPCYNFLSLVPDFRDQLFGRNSSVLLAGFISPLFYKKSAIALPVRKNGTVIKGLR